MNGGIHVKKIKILVLFSLAFFFITGCAKENNAGKNKETSKNEETIIYLVRHGKTWFNTTGQVQGFCDSPLTDVGVEQAKKVGDKLSNVKFVGAYSSDLGRQRNTAKEILKKNENMKPQVTELEGLKEWNFGSFEGKTNTEMYEVAFKDTGFKEEEYFEMQDSLGGVAGVADLIAEKDPLEEAENYDSILNRVKKATDKIMKETTKKGGRNVLIVTSGGTIPALIDTIAPGEYKGEDIENCSITTIKYKDGKYTLGKIGDTSHLEE